MLQIYITISKLSKILSQNTRLKRCKKAKKSSSIHCLVYWMLLFLFHHLSVGLFLNSSTQVAIVLHETNNAFIVKKHNRSIFFFSEHKFYGLSESVPVWLTTSKTELDFKNINLLQMLFHKLSIVLRLRFWKILEICGQFKHYQHNLVHNITNTT